MRPTTLSPQQPSGRTTTISPGPTASRVSAWMFTWCVTITTVPRGRFVEYVAGGPGQPNPPPSGYGVQTPRLVPTGVDF